MFMIDQTVKRMSRGPGSPRLSAIITMTDSLKPLLRPAALLTLRHLRILVVHNGLPASGAAEVMALRPCSHKRGDVDRLRD